MNLHITIVNLHAGLKIGNYAVDIIASWKVKYKSKRNKSTNKISCFTDYITFKLPLNPGNKKQLMVKEKSWAIPFHLSCCWVPKAGANQGMWTYSRKLYSHYCLNIQNESKDYLVLTFRELQVILTTNTALLFFLQHPAFSALNFSQLYWHFLHRISLSSWAFIFHFWYFHPDQLSHFWYWQWERRILHM